MRRKRKSKSYIAELESEIKKINIKDDINWFNIKFDKKIIFLVRQITSSIKIKRI